MKKNKSVFVLLFTLITLLLVSCGAKNDETVRNEGTLTSSKSEPITSEYIRNSDEPFFASLDFSLRSGRVDWELKNPKDAIVFAGYAVFEDGTTYRQLTLPSEFLKGIMKQKEEVKEGPDFNYLQFDTPAMKGVYKLILKPQNAEGKYIVEWHSRLPRK